MGVMKLVFLFLGFMIFTSCATRLPMPAGIPEVSPADYETLNTKKTKKP